jgi:hypothetical protein
LRAAMGGAEQQTATTHVQGGGFWLRHWWDVI